MNIKKIIIQCYYCESDYTLSYMEDSTSKDLPDMCPFCGEPTQKENIIHVDNEFTEYSSILDID